MSKDNTHHSVHREWLQQIQPEGLVVTAPILEQLGFYLDRNIGDEKALLRDLIEIEEVSLDHDGQNVTRLLESQHKRFFEELLQWGEQGGNQLELLSGAKLEEQQHLSYDMPEYDEILSPTYALYELPEAAEEEEEWEENLLDQFDQPSDEDAQAEDQPKEEVKVKYNELKPKLLIVYIKDDKKLDEKQSAGKKKEYWDETHHNRFERLLRESNMDEPVGLLMNDLSLRLVYAPKGESSGYMTFEFAHLMEASGRNLFSALMMILRGSKLIESDKNSLHKALKASRKHQNKISTQLSNQVLDSFWALLRGFEAAHMGRIEGDIHEAFRELALNHPNEVYEGILTSIMRLIFLVYVEEEGLIQDDQSQIYQRSYSVTGLFQRLEADRAKFQGSMTERRGAWAQLLSLTRMIYGGGEYQGFKVPVRQGELFAPNRFPFLEGRRRGDESNLPLNVPPVSDECIYQVLQNLLILNGERLSYRALGVEEIGSVYESMMGYNVECAKSDSVVLKSNKNKKKGTQVDVVIRLIDLLTVKGSDRKKWLDIHAEVEFSSSKTEKERLKLLKEATNEDELFDALKGKLSSRSSERLVEGSLYLQPGEERRRSGSHYTPRSLSSPVVSRALEPHLKKIEAMDEDKRAQAILNLKVCDPAMGSGAFLVEACRQLADALVEAWRVTGRLITEVGSEEAVLEARRRVTQSCLYGVDKNPYAVSLAKLSLWLFTLSKEESFTFLDHSLRCGDSLVGISNDGLKRMQWVVNKESGQLSLDFTQGPINEAIEKRLELNQNTSSTWAEMHQQLEETEDVMYELKVIADALVAAFFTERKAKSREALRSSLEAEVGAWISHKTSGKFEESRSVFEKIRKLADQLSSLDHPVSPFHWGLEFPEVAVLGGFDAFVGNPPFMGKNTLASSVHVSYPHWLKELHSGSHGNADVVAHFFRRTYTLLRSKGSLGLVTTNTVSQGDSRETGLTWICEQEDAIIYDAVKRLVWPGDAAVVVSTVHLSRGQPTVDLLNLLNGREVESISAFLSTGNIHKSPKSLLENSGLSFKGSTVLGIGFTFNDSNKATPYDQEGTSAIGTPTPIADMEALIQKDPKNRERIFPYIGGAELNTHPSHKPHRYVINFGNMSEGDARKWPDLVGIVERKVKPSRLKLKSNQPAHINWWKYERRRVNLYQAIEGLDRVLATSQTSFRRTFTFLEPGKVYDQKLVIFALSRYSQLSTLQSNIHINWSKEHGIPSLMKIPMPRYKT